MTESFNPQFSRNHTQSLNGEWTVFSSVKEINGKKILVPYCIESSLSGIGYTGFVKDCVYTRNFSVEKTAPDQRVFLHFGAVDYESRLYINDRFVGSHIGGYTHFDFDITDFVTAGENALRLEVFDDISQRIPSGKQSDLENSYGCYYTRTTGIWQNVWLEYTPNQYIQAFFFDTDIDDCSLTVDVTTAGDGPLSAEVRYEGRLVGTGGGETRDGRGKFTVKLGEKHLWECGKGRLYDVVLRFGADVVTSYFGLRSVAYDGYRFLLNGKSVFQRLVLDQGFDPDGIYTAPSRETMQKDIESALAFGFNGARLHQKVFDPYFLYLCDKAGYMVWGEFPSWGVDYSRLDSLPSFSAQWEECVKFQYNHPSIVTWCPLNEAWVFGERQVPRDVRFIDAVYDLTKRMDATRPCVDVSGGFHGRATDIYDYHCYAAPKEFIGYIRQLEKDDILEVPMLHAAGEDERYQKGLPVLVSEFGGISYRASGAAVGPTVGGEDWGYGNTENSFDTFFARYEPMVNAMLDCEKISGFCYTQLYDVEQERNGLLFYDRTPKFTEEEILKIASCNRRTAKIEK